MWDKDYYIRKFRHKTLNVSNVVSAMGLIVDYLILIIIKNYFLIVFLLSLYC